jgi:hypothetical protein
MEAIMVIIGAVIAFGMAIASVSTSREAVAAEAAPITSPFTPPQPLVNRAQPLSSETDTLVGDREQLRRYFLQDRPESRRR